MVSFKYILAFVSITSALVVERDVPTVLNNLKSIDTALNKLTQDTKSWQGTVAGILTIYGDEGAVEHAFNSTITELQAETSFNAADGKTLSDYVTAPLKPDFTTTIDTLVRRKPDFKAAGVGGGIRQNIQNLNNELQALCKALQGVVVVPQPNAAIQGACQQLYMILNNAIAAYSS